MTYFMKPFLIGFLVAAPPAAIAQSSDTSSDQATETTEATDTEQTDTGDLLTQAELENLVAPVALYPDTLLIQILVAATYPLQVVKGDRLLAQNEGQDPEVVKAAIEAEEWDPSVEVLTTAFPDVISDMATHIEWTETVGDAMLAQSDEVMTAVQTMRTQAIETGALLSGEEQVVEVEDDSTVIIQPADPEVVYVPQYDSDVVYTTDNTVSDAIVTGAVIFGTFALIDAIFDDDDDWNDYWGCRNCGGWGGGPIYRNPDIDIDIDGNVNIGNNVNIGDRPDRRPDGGWKPEDGRQKEARDKISNKRDGTGKSNLPLNKAETRGDSLRTQLSSKSGAADISRPGAQPDADRLPQVNRPSNRPEATKRAAADRTASRPKASGTNRQPAAQRPAVKQPSARNTPAKRPSTQGSTTRNKPKATSKRSSGSKARASSSRGRSSGGKRGGRR